MSLRNQVIRLAYEKPELRSKLLPLIKEAKAFSSQGQLDEYIDSLETEAGKEKARKTHTVEEGGDSDAPSVKDKGTVGNLWGLVKELFSSLSGSKKKYDEASSEEAEHKKDIMKQVGWGDLDPKNVEFIVSNGEFGAKNPKTDKFEALEVSKEDQKKLDKLQKKTKKLKAETDKLQKEHDKAKKDAENSGKKPKSDSKKPRENGELPIGDKGQQKKKREEMSKTELVKAYEEAIKKSDMSPEEKKKALEKAKKPGFDPEAALGAMGDDEEEDGGKTASKTAGRDMPALSWVIPYAEKAGAREETFLNGGVRVWRWETEFEDRRSGKTHTRYHLVVASGNKRARRAMVYEYHSRAASRDQKVDRIVANMQSKIDAKAKAREEARNFQHGYQVGDILYASWGYDQTNVDWYQVTRLVGAKMIEIHMIGGKDAGRDRVMPVPNSFSSRERPFKVKVRTDRSVKTRGGVANAYPWDGKPKYETSPYAGH